MSTTETRDWLIGAIVNGRRHGCAHCVRTACARHAAEAVLEACRREELFIMPRADADALLAAERQRMREGIAQQIKALMSQANIPVRDAALAHAATVALNYRDEDDEALEVPTP